MPTVGDLYTPHLDLPEGTADTQVALDVLDGADSVTAWPVTADDPSTGIAWTGAPARLLVAGEWQLTWTITIGASPAYRLRQVLLVDPDPAGPPAGFAYATTADLAAYSGQPVPAGARRMLQAATCEIDRLTLCARYAVDPATGLARDPGVRQALADAVCELVGWWVETGMETGAQSMFTNASIAGASVSWAAVNSQNPQAGRVGPKVFSILLQAGLLATGAVMTEG